MQPDAAATYQPYQQYFQLALLMCCQSRHVADTTEVYCIDKFKAWDLTALQHHAWRITCMSSTACTPRCQQHPRDTDQDQHVITGSICIVMRVLTVPTELA
ncbi:hypothetical protein VOLCADRAFT_87822 [Volvox carteri f. nagariensis]|uniref:Uncharacterized protein n=1 Tax=Volvox carteri f. nagariensis TaxID=3068 RepID=D8TMC2_VOLCA|nr:uncharacterized protein VOLCADRAFT_87822 [Volvox carteri f. nagariensis]EFJ51619.1 hypothetical protein VOLCADRAFT_87822 [Volvox carteri f. nagariensis]|eukprot:XP_002947571.1 hypothetical protein VOLCADRAFT_87822 [Volvox carteri f. nagariensis]